MRERSWEYAGKTVEEAIQTALEELGLERDDVHVEVLEEQQKGFLGIGGREARIRVELIGEWEVTGGKEEAEGCEPQEPEEEPGPGVESAPAENTARPLKMVKDILDMLGTEAMVEAREREDSIVIDVWGEDVAILIGKGGGTLDSLQYVVNVGCRRGGTLEKRIIIDVEGYRKRRKARLEKQAEQMAGRAVAEGKRIELPPMNASERKTVHMILRDYEGVTTESTGDEPNRRVVIVPTSSCST